jgi:hypothetical protein
MSTQRLRAEGGTEMQRRPFNRVGLVAIGLAGLIAVTAATALAARSTASPFELIVEGKETWEYYVPVSIEETFTSRAPFCPTGTVVDLPVGKRFTCDDGTGSLTFSRIPQWRGDMTAEWQIVQGSDSYADLRGRGSVHREALGGEIEDPDDGSGYWAWRDTFDGTVDWDAVAPTIAFTSASASKLRRVPGVYLIRVAISLGDNVEGNPVTYKLKATERRTELARKEGTTASGSVVTTLRVEPSSKRVRSVDLHLRASDPIGNEQFLVRTLKLPR